MGVSVSHFFFVCFPPDASVLITNISVITNPPLSQPPANFTGALSQGSADIWGVCTEKNRGAHPQPGLHIQNAGCTSRTRGAPLPGAALAPTRPAPGAGTGAAPPAGTAGLAPLPPRRRLSRQPRQRPAARSARQLSHRRTEQFPLFVCAARPAAPSARTAVPALPPLPSADPPPLPGGAPRGRGVPLPPPPPSPAR